MTIKKKAKSGAHVSKNHPYSGLEKHERKGGKLVAPFNAKLGTKPQLISWRDFALNEMLWAILLRANIEQAQCIDAFRLFLENARDNLPNKADTFITHSALSAVSEQTFDVLVAPLLSIDVAREPLRALLLVDCLPDRGRWTRHLSEPNPATHLKYLIQAVASCTDHQSPESTDVRWLKLFYFTFICQKMRFSLEDGDKSRDRMREIIEYPDYGDQSRVRAGIRAGEIMLRSSFSGESTPNEIPQALKESLPSSWSEEFWRECLKKSPCIPLEPKRPAAFDAERYVKQLVVLWQEISAHFHNSLENTDVDARRDAAFGLPLYATMLAIDLHHVGQRADGRLLLRSIVEALIVLKFLVSKDDPTLWAQFRNYGSGQAKLAFLKNLKDVDVPSFINLDDLQLYASEDMWQEYVDIDLESWIDRNLRSMAEQAGIKDVYDKYYDWSSHYIHARWGAIRESVFTTCMNPLHRYHRIPIMPRVDMPSVVPDAARLINRMLDLLSETYPPFKARIKHAFDPASDSHTESDADI